MYNLFNLRSQIMNGYIKPNMNDLPAELGKKIFEEMDKTRVDFDELDKKCLKIKLEILKEKENEKANSGK